MQILPIGNKKGFTLLEVLIVMVLISIATGLILPSFSSMQTSFSADATKRKLLNLFQQARVAALTTRKQQVIQVKKGKIIYSLSSGQVYQLDDINIISSSQKKFIFFEDGTNSGGTLDIRCLDKNEYKFTINQLTSKIEMSVVHE